MQSKKIQNPKFKNAVDETSAYMMFILGLIPYSVFRAILLPVGIAVNFYYNGESLLTSKIKESRPHADEEAIKEIRKRRNKRNLHQAKVFTANYIADTFESLDDKILEPAHRRVVNRRKKYQEEVEAAQKAAEAAAMAKEKQAKQEMAAYELQDRENSMRCLPENPKDLFKEFGIESLLDFISNARKIIADYDTVIQSPNGKTAFRTVLTIDDKVRLDEMDILIRESDGGEFKKVFTFADKYTMTRRRFILFGMCKRRQKELSETEAKEKTDALRAKMVCLVKEQHTK